MAASDPAGSDRARLVPRFLPFVNWRRPDATTLRADLLAGIAVSLLAIPQSLAYAQLAGVPAHYGLYAAFLPSIVAVLFGSSAILSTGPVALTSLLTAASVSQLAPAGTSQFFAYVTLLAFVSGVLQLALGLARAGVLVNLLSHPVLMGFVNAAALLITLSQLPALTGISVETSRWLLLDVGRMLLKLDTLHPWTLALGAIALALLYAFRRFAPKLPGVLIMVIVLTLLSYATGFAGRGGRVVGAIPVGLPTFAVPDADWPAIVELLPAAFVIALISFMEVMSSSKVIAIRTRTRWDENQELIGQGLAKIVAGFSQTMPVSGSFSRSALNLATGARSGWSALFAAAFVLLTLLFLTPLFFHLPQPALAAMIIMAVFNLFDMGALRRAWRANRDDGIAAVVTFAATLVFAPNIQNGILTGVLLSLGAYIYRRMTPRTTVATVTIPASPATGADGNAGVDRLTGSDGTQGADTKVHVLTFDAALFFGNISFFEEAVLRIVEAHPDLTRIAVDASGINGIDASAVEVIRSLVRRLRENGATLVFFDVKPRFMEVAARTGLLEEIGVENVSAAGARGPLQERAVL